VPLPKTFLAVVPDSPTCYASIHLDRIEKFPFADKMLIRQPGYNTSQRQWQHDLDYDAESIFWLLVYWANTVQPVECSIEDINAGSWSYLLGTAAARQTLLLGLAQYQQKPGLIHSLYDLLRELIVSLAAILVVDQYWLAESDVRNDSEYINEAFQCLILNFIVTNSHEKWMGHSDEKCLRSVLPVPRADALSAMVSQDTNIAERKQPSPQASSMSSTKRCQVDMVKTEVSSGCGSWCCLFLMLLSLQGADAGNEGENMGVDFEIEDFCKGWPSDPKKVVCLDISSAVYTIPA
jgi:hypothetical protein